MVIVNKASDKFLALTENGIHIRRNSRINTKGIGSANLEFLANRFFDDESPESTVRGLLIANSSFADVIQSSIVLQIRSNWVISTFLGKLK